jgi:hypothetical protein
VIDMTGSNRLDGKVGGIGCTSYSHGQVSRRCPKLKIEPCRRRRTGHESPSPSANASSSTSGIDDDEGFRELPSRDSHSDWERELEENGHRWVGL